MYVEQFWKCFEETGDISTYLSLKEYEKLYNEHTNLVITSNEINVETNDLDRMK